MKDDFKLYVPNKEIIDHKYDGLIANYRNHREIKDLADAVRNHPEIFESEIIRNFIADIVEGKEKPPPPKGLIKLSTKNRMLRYSKKINIYHAMGLPVMKSQDYDDITCCKLLSEEEKRNTQEIYKLWLKYKFWHLNWALIGRVMFYLNNLEKPNSLEKIHELEKEYDSLSHEELREINEKIIKSDWYKSYDKKG